MTHRTTLLPALCLLLALAAPAAAAAGDETKRVPILAWGGPPADQTTPERYRELAEAGFTINFSGHGDPDALARALDVAAGAGVKLLVSIPQLKDDPAGTAARFKDHPALAGYYIRDEPGAALFDELAEWCRKIQAVDPVHPCYVNLFPNYATPDQLNTPTYQAYLDAFVAKVPTPMLSFDHYPVVGTTLRGEWYDNLERAAATARKAKRPLWAFVLSVAHQPYPVPTLAHLRVQAFSNLAYGAQTIQYFTYWTSASDVWDFNNAPIALDGQRTPVYDLVKQVNGEIQNVARAFVGSELLAVGHTGERPPAGTNRYEPAAPVAAVETEGDGAVVSLLSNESKRYLVVVNRDINKPMPLTIRLDGSKRVERVSRDGVARPAAAPVVQERVEPGDVLILTWDE